MSPPLLCYLRRERRKWAFTQEELAFLLGKTSTPHISRLEQGKSPPSAAILIACEVLFDTTSRTIFPKRYTEIEELVLARAAELYALLESEKTPAAHKKKEFLHTLLNRAITHLNQEGT